MIRLQQRSTPPANSKTSGKPTAPTARSSSPIARGSRPWPLTGSNPNASPSAIAMTASRKSKLHRKKNHLQPQPHPDHSSGGATAPAEPPKPRSAPNPANPTSAQSTSRPNQQNSFR